MGGWWRWALVSPDGVAPSRMVGVSASVNLPLHHKIQKFTSGTGSPGWSRTKGRKTVVVVVVTENICELMQNWQSTLPVGKFVHLVANFDHVVEKFRLDVLPFQRLENVDLLCCGVGMWDVPYVNQNILLTQRYQRRPTCMCKDFHFQSSTTQFNPFPMVINNLCWSAD